MPRVVAASESIRWGQAPLGFEVTSSDRVVLEKMALVLRPWRTVQATLGCCRWRAEPNESNAPGSWEVRCDHCHQRLVGSTRDWVAQAVEFGAVHAYLDSDKIVAVHGALVAQRDSGLLIVGRSGAGKSTLACALWERGWTLLSDDVTLLDPGRRLGWPTPRRVSLRLASRNILDRALWDRIVATPACDTTGDAVLFHPDEVDGRRRSVAVRVNAVAMLDRRDRSEGPEIRRLDPAHALLALLPYTNLRERPNDGIRRLGPLMEAVPMYDLGRGSLPAMTHAAQRFLAPLA
jgi:hypothetical protein